MITQLSSQEKAQMIQEISATKIGGFFGEYRPLSNMWLCKVVFEGVTYPSSENAYQAAKFSTVQPYAQRLRSQFVFMSPKRAKNLGQRIHLWAYTEEEWQERKLSVMRQILWSKFYGNQKLGDFLLSTAGKHLEETNWWGDTFFGVAVYPDSSRQGQNHLGRLLMETRRELSMVRSGIKSPAPIK
jgi:N-glycosidase YbiA